MSADTHPWEVRLGLAPNALAPLQAQLNALPGPEALALELEPLLLGPGGAAWLPETVEDRALAQQALARMAYAAPFLLRRLSGRPAEHVAELLSGLQQPATLRPWGDYAGQTPLGELEDDAFMRALRHWKYDCYARVTAQELLGLHGAQTTCRLLSGLADGAVRLALAWGFGHHAARRGIPLHADGSLVAPVVIGMGKLGGQELNYASDIDLIFLQDGGGKACHPLQGSPPDFSPEMDDADYWAAWQVLARDAASHAASGEVSGFHDRVARGVIRQLSNNTVDGFGFRVDADLRPLGRAAALVPTLSTAEDYYEHHGREWERTAMVKARCIAGDPALGAQFMQMIRPFTYRRYLDYSALEGIALVKHDIDRSQGGESSRNLKLGQGGIRENEFFVQAQQLIYGGRRPDLRVTNHDAALSALQAAGLLPEEDAQALREAYWHLRAVENRVQMVAEQQTHDLPEPPEEQQRVLHDFAADFAQRLPAALTALEAARSGTGNRFSSLCRGMGEMEMPEVSEWHSAVRQHLPAEQAEAVLPRIDALFKQLMTTRMGERCVFKLGKLLTHDQLYVDGSEPAFPRWVAFFEQIGNRNALYVLMDAHPPIVDWVAEFFREAGRNAELLIRHPELLESYFTLSEGEEALAAPFREAVTRAADEEEFLLELQRAKLHGTVRALTHYLADPESRGHSALLTTMADEALDACLRYAWQQLVERMGVPEGATADAVHGFSVLAMGRWGSRDMRFSSDLDLVFLRGPEGRTSKGRAHSEFYNKLGQKVTTLLTAPTQFGYLYELDHRLRPFGNKGVLVPSLQAYINFLDADAQVWNYQAFTRLRPVCGDAALSAGLMAEIERGWLARTESPQAIAAEVWDMLGKLIAANGRSGEGLPLKFALGGMLGFEFYAQFRTLLASREAGAWTLPTPDGIMVDFRTDYETLSALNERLSFYQPSEAQVAQPEVFERFRAIGARWSFPQVREQANRMEAALNQAFANAMQA